MVRAIEAPARRALADPTLEGLPRRRLLPDRALCAEQKQSDDRASELEDLVPQSLLEPLVAHHVVAGADGESGQPVRLLSNAPSQLGLSSRLISGVSSRREVAYLRHQRTSGALGWLCNPKIARSPRDCYPHLTLRRDLNAASPVSHERRHSPKDIIQFSGQLRYKRKESHTKESQ